MVAHQEDGEWLSVAGAARRLGVSRQAIQKRIARGRIENRRDNMGNPQVWVAAPPVTEVPGAPPRTLVAPSDPQPLPSASEMLPLSAHIATIEAIQAGHREAVTALRSDMGAERQRHLAELTRLEHAYKSAADALMAKVSAVLVASRPRRSWWRW